MAEAELNLDNPVGANGGDSAMVRRYIEAWAADPGRKRHNILMINAGLHDIKISKHDDSGMVVSPDEYRENLAAIVTAAPAIADHFAWITTTAVDDEKHAKRRKFGFHRYNRDVDVCNQIAHEVMTSHNIPIVDMAAYTKHLIRDGETEADLYTDGVHFQDWVTIEQGRWIAGWILGHLAAH